jgi:membrane protease YdiL (CAAX protease family)
MPSPSQNFTPPVYHGAPPDPYADDPPTSALEGVAVFVAGAALFVATALVTRAGLISLVLGEAAFAATAIAYAIARGRPRSRLGLRVPPARALIGAAIVGASLWYANARNAAPIARALGEHEMARLEQRLEGHTLALALVVAAVMPAVCEELVCRGVLARALRPALGRAIAIATSALLFAAFHLSLSRFVPTALLGAAVGAIAIAADSVWPAIVAHLLNNGVAIAISAGALHPVSDAIDSAPDLAIVVSLALTAGGLVIALAPRRPA